MNGEAEKKTEIQERILREVRTRAEGVDIPELLKSLAGSEREARHAIERLLDEGPLRLDDAMRLRAVPQES
jgi:hypothetical protein